MMRFRTALLFAALLAGGCTQLPEARLKDESRMNAAHRGMRKPWLLRAMGTELVTVYEPDGTIRAILPNPYRTEIWSRGGRAFEIVQYFTNPEPRGGPVERDELTPFVFENGELIGWGWEFMAGLESSLRDEGP